ncbi:MAG: hypothetical protein ACQSGP_15265 [Frankia sp.]
MSSPTETPGLITLDVVLLLPADARVTAVASSRELARRMTAGGSRSHFLLGEPFPGPEGGCCEPHVSLFMLCVTPAEVAGVVDQVRSVAATTAPLAVTGSEYRHNPWGAPELYYARSPDWFTLQDRVVRAVEPLRRGRLRDVDPAGRPLRDAGALTGQPGSTEADAAGQVRRYGYDEVTDDLADRFHPHVTLAWPDDPASRVDLSGLAAADAYSGTLSKLAVFGMSPWGTCTTPFGAFTFTGAAAQPAAADH